MAWHDFGDFRTAKYVHNNYNQTIEKSILCENRETEFLKHIPSEYNDDGVYFENNKNCFDKYRGLGKT